MRPGRLDRIVFIGPPNQAGREDILRIRTKKMSVEPGFDVARIAAMVRTACHHDARMLANRDYSDRRL